MRGEAEIAIGAGAEIMSRAPYFVPAARWGLKMGEAVMQVGLTGALTDNFQSIHMGVTAENVATRYGISRAEQDAQDLESQRRAGNAKIGRANVCTPVTNAQLVSPLMY